MFWEDQQALLFKSLVSGRVKRNTRPREIPGGRGESYRERFTVLRCEMAGGAFTARLARTTKPSAKGDKTTTFLVGVRGIKPAAD